MICPNCSKKYLDPPFHCIECQTELGWRCTACQQGNSLLYKYCGKCGSPIPPGLMSQIAKGEQARIINIPQYGESAIVELMEERQRSAGKKQIKNFSQNEIDNIFT
jgi:hypothetical protein